MATAFSLPILTAARLRPADTQAISKETSRNRHGLRRHERFQNRPPN
jgi:hypothetical protein